MPPRAHDQEVRILAAIARTVLDSSAAPQASMPASRPGLADI
jgi:hypothetical protein